MKRIFNFRHLFGTLFVFLFMGLIGSIGIQVEFLNVFEDVFEDFKLSDFYYHSIRDDKDVLVDDRIVVVNIGNLDRRGIAQQIDILSQYKPLAIGADFRIFEEKEEDPIGDYLLAEAIKNAENFVLASEPFDGDEVTKSFKSLMKPPPFFLDSTNAITGHVWTGEVDQSTHFPTWREIAPVLKLSNGVVEPSLAVQMARFIAPEKVERFLARNNEFESIYFRGNVISNSPFNMDTTRTGKFFVLDFDDVLDDNFEPSLIEGKLVVMGYMGGDLSDYHFDEDKFYTPLNKDLLGRGEPDMFGVVVHANIISMILEEKYVDDMPQFVSYLIAFLVCYFNVTIFSNIVYNRSLAIWYNGISKLIQLFETLFVFTINIFLFSLYNYQADLTITIFAIVLSGDLVEIYVDVLLNFIDNKVKPKIKSLSNAS